jgi:hypothetical protein
MAPCLPTHLMLLLSIRQQPRELGVAGLRLTQLVLREGTSRYGRRHEQHRRCHITSCSCILLYCQADVSTTNNSAT